jgi:hypothetical protein
MMETTLLPNSKQSSKQAGTGFDECCCCWCIWDRFVLMNVAVAGVLFFKNCSIDSGT